MKQHAVTLPHPSRNEAKTVGTCDCGWTISYGWGGHGEAVAVACDHIEQEGRAQPVEARRIDGEVLVMEGLSL